MDWGKGKGLLRRSRFITVLHLLFVSASPRNDVASDWGFASPHPRPLSSRRGVTLRWWFVLLAGASKVDCARGTSLLRRSRTKLVLLFYISSASPRNDGAPIGVLGLAGTSKVDCARGTSLLRRNRTKLVLLFHFSSASPRNDGASIGVLGLAGTSKVDCARGTSLLRRNRTKLVLLFYI